MFTRCSSVVAGLLGVLLGACGNPGNKNAIGRPCDLLADTGAAQATYNPAAAECPSSLCLKPAVSFPSNTSFGVDTGATCSAGCTTDSDCDGETRDPRDPNDKRCQTGFVCGIAAVVGPLCCRKVCMCKDFLAGSLTTPITCDPAQNQGLGCQDSVGAGSAGQPLQETDFSVLLTRDRTVDILFMVDNSPSMDPKQNALAANFVKMISVLQTIPDSSGGSSLPDVHIGVISSDMGSGSDPIGSNCRRILGDRGLLYGNDPKNPLASVNPNADPNAGGHPQPNGCGLHEGQRWISDIADPAGNGKRIKNYDGNIQDVFSCLAKSVGTNGCGFEHQLQSTRVALNVDYPNNTINPENIGFVRPNGYLAIVLITDEDDCSADPDDAVNDSMFLENPPTETGSLRCATRGHVCNGQPIPGYDDPSIGFQPPNLLPAPNVGFTTALANCAPKDQPNPSNPDHHYLPLIRVQDMIDSVQGIIRKSPGTILVSGIIGWPPDTALTGVTTTDQYRIGVDTTSLPAPQNAYWDYMPICTVPGSKSADGNIYKSYGGLRLKKFLDAFQKKDTQGNLIPNTFSLCNQDFSPAMTAIANAIVQVLKPGCVQYPLVDTNPAAPGIQPECQLIDRIPCDVPGKGNCLQSGYQEYPRAECIDPTTGLPLDPTDPQRDDIPDAARPCWYLYYDTGCQGTYMNQRITVLRPVGTVAPAGTVLGLRCLTCPRADGNCPPFNP